MDVAVAVGGGLGRRGLVLNTTIALVLIILVLVLLALPLVLMLVAVLMLVLMLVLLPVGSSALAGELVRIGLHLIIRQQARVELRTRRLTIELATNAHKLCAPITVQRVPRIVTRRLLSSGEQVALDLILELVRPPITPRGPAMVGSQPKRAGRQGELCACQRSVGPLTRPRREPRSALETRASRHFRQKLPHSEHAVWHIAIKR